MNNRIDLLEAPFLAGAWEEALEYAGAPYETIAMLTFPAPGEDCPTVAFSFWMPRSFRLLTRHTLRGIFNCGIELAAASTAAFQVQIGVYNEGDYAATIVNGLTTVSVWFPAGDDVLGVFDLDITNQLATIYDRPIVEIQLTRIVSAGQQEVDSLAIDGLHIRTLTLAEEAAAITAGTIQPWI